MNYKSFNKSSDPLTLFFHWCMVHHRFKYIEKNQNPFIADDWNTASKDSYLFEYSKHEIKYQLQLDHSNGTLHMLLKRMSDMNDVKGSYFVEDYIENDYKNSAYTSVFKMHGELYEKVKFSIERLKNGSYPCSSTSSRRSSISSTRSKSKDKKPTSLIKKIKPEKMEFDALIQNQNSRRSSTCSNKSTSTVHSNLDCITNDTCKDGITVSRESLDKDVVKKQPTLTSKASLGKPNSICIKKETITSENGTTYETSWSNNMDENITNPLMTSKKRSVSSNGSAAFAAKKNDYFVANPITNYLHYNKETNNQLMEQNLLSNGSEWVKELFMRHNIANCTIPVVNIQSIKLIKEIRPKSQILLTKSLLEELSQSEVKPTIVLNNPPPLLPPPKSDSNKPKMSSKLDKAPMCNNNTSDDIETDQSYSKRASQSSFSSNCTVSSDMANNLTQQSKTQLTTPDDSKKKNQETIFYAKFFNKQKF